MHKTLTDPFRTYLTDEAGLQGIETFHEPGILFGGERLYFLRVSRPLKAEARDQPFIQEQKAVALKKEAFDPVGFSATEQEKGAFLQRIELEIFLNEKGKTVVPLRRSV